MEEAAAETAAGRVHSKSAHGLHARKSSSRLLDALHKCNSRVRSLIKYRWLNSMLAARAHSDALIDPSISLASAPADIHSDRRPAAHEHAETAAHRSGSLVGVGRAAAAARRRREDPVDAAVGAEGAAERARIPGARQVGQQARLGQLLARALHVVRVRAQPRRVPAPRSCLRAPGARSAVRMSAPPNAEPLDPRYYASAPSPGAWRARRRPAVPPAWRGNAMLRLDPSLDPALIRLIPPKLYTLPWCAPHGTPDAVPLSAWRLEQHHWQCAHLSGLASLLCWESDRQLRKTASECFSKERCLCSVSGKRPWHEHP